MNLVSMDSYVPDYGHFSKLVKVALELEDCFGKGENSITSQNSNNFWYNGQISGIIRNFALIFGDI